MKGSRRQQHEPLDISSGSPAPAKNVPKVIELPPGTRIIDLPRVTVGQKPVKILDAGDGRFSVRLFNDGSQGGAMGGPQLQKTTGTKIPPGLGWNEKDAPDAEIWAVCTAASGTTTFRIQIVALDRK